MANEKKKREDEIYAGDPKSGEYKPFPRTPSTMDYFKESFEPTATRAMLEALRRRKTRGS